MKFAMNLLSAAFALVAAVLWWRSAIVKLPKEANVSWGGVGGTIQDLNDAVREQSKLSAYAAISAALAAILQAAVTVIDL